jgi:hypothetical protein
MEDHTQWMGDDNQDGAARLENEEDGNEDNEEDAAHDDEEEEVENIEVEDRSTPLTVAMRDPHFQELLMNNISIGARAGDRWKSKLAQLEIDLRTLLYDAPSHEPEENYLRVALDLLEMKARHRWSDSSVDNLFRWLKKRFPKDNSCAGSLNEAKKIVSPLDLPHTKYHACINDCIIYWNEHADETTCPVCKADRYKRGTKKAPRKVVWYFPLRHRLLGVRFPLGYAGLISRYLDPNKKIFSGIKSHDCHVMMTQILLVAIRGIMEPHVRQILTGLYHFFDIITQNSISVKKLGRL